VIADRHGNVRHLGERDVRSSGATRKSSRRRARRSMRSCARRSARLLRQGVRDTEYTNAGTVEFLVEDGEFYFMEVNTEFRSSIPSAKKVTGIDTSGSCGRRWRGTHVRSGTMSRSPATRSSTEINARRTPPLTFAPTPGRLTTYSHRRVSCPARTMRVAGRREIGGDYDSMIAKLIVRGDDRDHRLERWKRTFGTPLTSDGVLIMTITCSIG